MLRFLPPVHFTIDLSSQCGSAVVESLLFYQDTVHVLYVLDALNIQLSLVGSCAIHC